MPSIQRRVGLLVLALLALLLSQGALALDVSWIPADPDGPLPLSTKYRAALKQLCTIMETSSKVPPELEAKKEVMKKLCRRLREDESLVGGSYLGNLKSLGRLGVGVCIAACAGAAWVYRDEIGSAVRGLLRGRGRALHTVSDAATLQAVREARMRRFAEEALKQE